MGKKAARGTHRRLVHRNESKDGGILSGNGWPQATKKSSRVSKRSKAALPKNDIQVDFMLYLLLNLFHSFVSLPVAGLGLFSCYRCIDSSTGNLLTKIIGLLSKCL